MKAWFGQKTTITGLSVLLGLGSAIASGQMTWQSAIPAALGALFATVVPEAKG